MYLLCIPTLGALRHVKSNAPTRHGKSPAAASNGHIRMKTWSSFKRLVAPCRTPPSGAVTSGAVTSGAVTPGAIMSGAYIAGRRLLQRYACAASPYLFSVKHEPRSAQTPLACGRQSQHRHYVSIAVDCITFLRWSRHCTARLTNLQ